MPESNCGTENRNPFRSIECSSGGDVAAIYDFAKPHAEVDLMFSRGAIFANKVPFYGIALKGDLFTMPD